MMKDAHAMKRTDEMRSAADWRQRPLTRALVLLVTWMYGTAYAVDFPTVPLQTGMVQPAPNVIFILDDSLSMTSQGGTALDTYLEWCENTRRACPNSPTESESDF